jgi:RimJ/RimL family protein N-acetyltransferase
MNASAADVIFAIVEKESGHHIGNITINSISWIDGTGELGTFVGDKEFWGRSYGTEAKSLVLDYAFQRLGLRKITSGHVMGNEASIKANLGLGFREEGLMKKQFFIDGQYLDIVRLGLFREDFCKFSTKAPKKA